MKTKKVSTVSNISDKSSKASISDNNSDDWLSNLLNFLCFYGSAAFRVDHPLRPLIQKHLQEGTKLDFDEAVKIFRQNKQWCSQGKMNADK